MARRTRKIAPVAVEAHVERRGPTEFRDPFVKLELQRAAVWAGVALAVAGVIVLAEPLLLIIGGLIFSVILDGGTRLLGRVLPIPRPYRLLIVILLGLGFVAWVVWYAGTTLAAQAEALRLVVQVQFARLMELLASLGLMPEGGMRSFGSQVVGSVGRLTTAIGSALGAVASMIMIIVIGIFIAAEPHLYDRGVAWMLPLRSRRQFYEITERVGWTLRRLLAGRLTGMVFEGVFTWLMLLIGGVPMAALLGLITGLLAFLPNIGAITSGVLMVTVGFSAGVNQGIWAIFVYFFVQNVDGYLVVPFIARRTVDLAPAAVLAAQLILGALFGILGVVFADPILASIKIALVEISRKRAAEEGRGLESTEQTPASP